MGEYLKVVSFELNDENLLNDWKVFSKEIDEDFASVEGFISRESGIDENGRIYCIVKWQSKTHQEEFMQRLTSSEDYPKIMEHFGSIANMDTMTPNNLEVF